MILFAYGVHGLTRNWQVAPAAAGRGLSAQLAGLVGEGRGL